MTPKLFFTGATGYIGGDVLYAVAHAHPDYDIACLVRNSDKGAQIASQYSKIRLVYGDLSNTQTLEEEAAKADIVVHCANADDEGAAKALVNGLARKGSLGFLVHTSGSGILCYADIERKVFGEEATKVYDDWDGVEEITSFPDAASHRNVDKVVIGAHTHSPSVKTAIVCPPCIYGPGRGPSNQRSMQLPELARCTLERKEGLQVGAGKARWANVHVHDMSNCFLKLVEAAIEGGGKATWGQEGYYFTENGEHYWGDLSKVVAKAAQKQGLLQSVNVAALSAQETDQLSHHGSVLWGANSRCKAIRARKLLGWSPKERSIEDEASDATAIEARSLGLTTGHAAKVAAA